MIERAYPKTVDLTGQNFGKWVVLKKVDKPGRTVWVCRCECGKESRIRAYALIQGTSKGCPECHDKTRKKHGGCGTTMYHIWENMISRCENKNHTSYKHYGVRGITVCERWRDSFSAFLEDMGERPEGMSLDRIDNDGSYVPGNVRWATRREQSRNTRSNRILEHGKERKVFLDWCDFFGIPYRDLNRYLKTHSFSEAYRHYTAITPPGCSSPKDALK